MTAQVVQAQNVSLRQLIDEFGLEFIQDENFFDELQRDLPELQELEVQLLDRIKASYFNLITDPPVLEKTVQMAIISPLLFLANFFLAPFQIKTEQSVEIVVEEGEKVIRGSLDILILKQGLWLLVIESKQLLFSVEAGLAQLLAYLLAQPNQERPCYGLVTNGANFLFVKLIRGEVPQYGTSSQFDIRSKGNELYEVLQILKRLSQL